MALLDHEVEIALLRFLRQRALRLEDLNLDANQTRMQWPLYNDICDDIAIGRARRGPVPRERDPKSRSMDGMSPATANAIRFDSSRRSLHNDPQMENDILQGDSEPESIFRSSRRSRNF